MIAVTTNKSFQYTSHVFFYLSWAKIRFREIKSAGWETKNTYVNSHKFLFYICVRVKGQGYTMTGALMYSTIYLLGCHYATTV